MYITNVDGWIYDNLYVLIQYALDSPYKFRYPEDGASNTPYLNYRVQGGSTTFRAEIETGEAAETVVGEEWATGEVTLTGEEDGFEIIVTVRAVHTPAPDTGAEEVNTRLSQLSWESDVDGAVYEVYINDIYQGQTYNKYWSLNKVYTSPPTPFGTGYYLPLAYFTAFTWRVDVVI